MSLDVQAGGRMVGDLKRGGEGPPPLTDGERTLIGVAAGRAGSCGGSIFPRSDGLRPRPAVS